MDVIKSRINVSDETFKENKAHNIALLKELESHLEKIRQGGPKQLRELHEKRGKLFVRERIKRLSDPDTFFLELSPLAAYDVYDNRHRYRHCPWKRGYTRFSNGKRDVA